MASVAIWTDGSGPDGDGWCGYGAILLGRTREREVFGWLKPPATNQQAEMMAAIAGLKALKGIGHEVNIFSDSAYVVNCFRNLWIVNWRANGWKTYSGSNVANRELWETLESLVANHDVTFRHVKGHNGNVMNERADKLARTAREWGKGVDRLVQSQERIREMRKATAPIPGRSDANAGQGRPQRRRRARGKASGR